MPIWMRYRRLVLCLVPCGSGDVWATPALCRTLYWLMFVPERPFNRMCYFPDAWIPPLEPGLRYSLFTCPFTPTCLPDYHHLPHTYLLRGARKRNATLPPTYRLYRPSWRYVTYPCTALTHFAAHPLPVATKRAAAGTWTKDFSRTTSCWTVLPRDILPAALCRLNRQNSHRFYLVRHAPVPPLRRPLTGCGPTTTTNAPPYR